MSEHHHRASTHTATPTTYHPDASESYTEAVVNAVADASDLGESPLHDGEYLESLYESIDPDALEQVLGSAADGGPVTVSFSYSGYRVTIDETGAVEVADG